jgi:hypothetical protein
MWGIVQATVWQVRVWNGEDGGPTKSRVDASKIRAGGLGAVARQEKSTESPEGTDTDVTNKLRNITVCSKLALKR